MLKLGSNNLHISASFRDPSGYVFVDKGQLYRSVKKSYKKEYDGLIKSHLYSTLVKKGMLIEHKEVKYVNKQVDDYKILKPRVINFISYPYEWCFSQLKDAALLTLRIQSEALKKGLVLKDASAFNVQFLQGKPVFIDTLSFDFYNEGQPWQGYRQFCQHFLAPLLLMSYKDPGLSLLTKSYLDGLPLNLASRLLPLRTYLNLQVLVHIHLHSLAEKVAHKQEFVNKDTKVISKKALNKLNEKLMNFILELEIKKVEKSWSDYYQSLIYTRKEFALKKSVIEQYTDIAKAKTVLDIGANTGEFSRIAAKKSFVLAIDNNHASIEKLYTSRLPGLDRILPLVLDITNPSPPLGWALKERSSFFERLNSDCVYALALVHHLAISNNLSFEQIISLLSKLGDKLIIEFIPKNDPNVADMFKFRKDIFPDYTQDNFERNLNRLYKIEERSKLTSYGRILYLCIKK